MCDLKMFSKTHNYYAHKFKVNELLLLEFALIDGLIIITSDLDHVSL